MKLNFDNLYRKYNMNITGVIHIGGHYGQEIEIYKNYPTIQKVIFFEPDKDSFNVLCENTKKYEHMKCINVALGSSSSIMKMYKETINNGASNSLLEPIICKIQYPHILFPDQVDVQVESLDKYNLDSIFNCIAMDTQGYELEVLKGSTNTLKNIKYIYAEVNRAEVYKNCPMIEDIDNFVKDFGFIRKEVEWDYDNGMSTWGDALYIKT